MEKTKTKNLFFLSVLFLIGCVSSPTISSETSSSVPKESVSSSENSDTDSLSSSESSLLSSFEEDSSSEEISSSSEEASSSSESSSEEVSSDEPFEEETFHFYCVNDFHGAVLEQYNGSYYEAGIAKYFGHLKELKEEDPEHTIILSAGDMYQGSLESNDNYGALVTEAMNAVPFDAMTIGNHEFDYGQQRLLDNVDRANFPMLGGNIVKFNEGTTTRPWSEKIGKSTIVSRSSYKIGIVGMIGEGQTTSITSKYVQDVDFAPIVSSSRTEALRLRQEEGCSMVILVVHDEYSEVSFAADKRYFDGVFCAHTHQNEDYLVSGVPFVQGICNGEAYSSFDITVTKDGPVCTSHGVNKSKASWNEDSEIASIRDSYILEPSFVTKSQSVAGTLSGTLTKNEGIPNIAAKAIYEKYVTLYPDLCCAMINSQRANLYSGEVTYSSLFKAMPFFNDISIARVKGSDILSEASYGMSTYTGDLDTYGSLNPNSFYTIACIDYVLYHQNTTKRYNYFYSLNKGNGGSIIQDHEDYPFDITFNYMKDDLSGVIYAADFLDSSSGFNAYA